MLLKWGTGSGERKSAVADPGEGPGGPGSPPLFLDQTEAQRAEKNFFPLFLPDARNISLNFIRLLRVVITPSVTSESTAVNAVH